MPKKKPVKRDQTLDKKRKEIADLQRRLREMIENRKKKNLSGGRSYFEPQLVQNPVLLQLLGADEDALVLTCQNQSQIRRC